MRYPSSLCYPYVEFQCSQLTSVSFPLPVPSNTDLLHSSDVIAQQHSKVVH
jgi:hypothetical protein